MPCTPEEFAEPRCGGTLPLLARAAGSLGALLWIAALSGCGGGGGSSGTASTPVGPTQLTLSPSNASTVAAEVMLSAGRIGSFAAAPTPGAAAASASVRALPAGRAQRLLAILRQPVRDAGSAAATNCAVSGTFSTVTSGTSATVTFTNCVDVAGVTMNGTEGYSNLATSSSASSTTITANITDDVTLTAGTVSETESGSFSIQVVLNTSQTTVFSSALFTLSGSTLSVAVSKSGSVVDSVTLSNFNIALEYDLTVVPNQLYSTFSYTVASSALGATYTVTTPQQIKQLVTHQYPYTGQVLISGSNKTRLLITILGDETYDPPAGQGQIEFQLDTGGGSYGTPFYVNWATLAAAQSSGSGTATYTIGGTVTGLPAGATIVLTDNGSDPLTLAANGSFTFLTPLASGASYTVAFASALPGTVSCTVSNGGPATVGSANVTNVGVSCSGG
jgi:hypothetical protein